MTIELKTSITYDLKIGGAGLFTGFKLQSGWEGFRKYINPDASWFIGFETDTIFAGQVHPSSPSLFAILLGDAAAPMAAGEIKQVKVIAASEDILRAIDVYLEALCEKAD
ncbi:hypothetical protein DRQ53_07985 [bacterium]|nr:MAG: hypothetical protein DRQ53_07985 [bacterium]